MAGTPPTIAPPPTPTITPTTTTPPTTTSTSLPPPPTPTTASTIKTTTPLAPATNTKPAQPHTNTSPPQILPPPPATKSTPTAFTDGTGKQVSVAVYKPPPPNATNTNTVVVVRPMSTTTTPTTTTMIPNQDSPGSKKRAFTESVPGGGCTECRKLGKFAPFRKTSHMYCCNMHHKHAEECETGSRERAKRRRTDARNRVQGGPGRAGFADRRNGAHGGTGRKVDKRNRAQGGPGRVKPSRRFTQKCHWQWKEVVSEGGVDILECLPIPTNVVAEDQTTPPNNTDTSSPKDAQDISIPQPPPVHTSETEIEPPKTDQPDKAAESEPLRISRLCCGLWQVADMEREGGVGLDEALAVEALEDVYNAGIVAFDMADHYGSAEKLFGKVRTKLIAAGNQSDVVGITKWVPKPGPDNCTSDAVHEAVELAASRMNLAKIPILQLHTWDYLDGPGAWLTQLKLLAAHPQVDRVGVTNFDAAHLRIALAENVSVATNQVCISLLDTRALGTMTQLCLEAGVRLLAFGVLAGGLLTDRYYKRAEPTAAELAASWSLAKYRRYVDSFGGWDLLQELLGTLRKIADKHIVDEKPVSIANVASRWVLEQGAVASIIVGFRPGHSNHTAENKKVFKFFLTTSDKTEITQVLSKAQPIHGDCGDEYRTPPFLTASGDLSHHLDNIPPPFTSTKLVGHTEERPKLSVSSGTHWESMAGYARGVRFGNRVCVSGTTSTGPNQMVVGGKDAGAQTTYSLDIVEATLKSLGAKLSDVVRTRLFVKNIEDWPLVAKAHGQRFWNHQPANTLVQATIVGKQYLVEVEAEAEVFD